MYQIVDTINIKVCLSNFCYNEKMVIGYIDNNIIITCGHCLPKNSQFKYGKILYTSGFANANEGQELAIVLIYPKYQKLFNPFINGKNISLYKKSITDNSDIILFNKGVSQQGKILTLISNNKLKKGIYL